MSINLDQDKARISLVSNRANKWLRNEAIFVCLSLSLSQCVVYVSSPSYSVAPLFLSASSCPRLVLFIPRRLFSLPYHFRAALLLLLLFVWWRIWWSRQTKTRWHLCKVNFILESLSYKSWRFGSWRTLTAHKSAQRMIDWIPNTSLIQLNQMNKKKTE